MKKFLFLIILGIFLIPLSATVKWAGDYLWYKQYLGLVFFFFLAMIFFIWNFNKWLAIFAGICLGSTFFITICNPRAMLLLWHLYLGCLCSYGISKFNQRHRKYILYSILGVVLLQFGWLIMQAWNLDPYFYAIADPTRDAMVGLSSSADQLGTFFALTTPLMLYIYWPLAALSFAGIIISKSSFAFVAAVLSSLLYLGLTNKKMFFNALIICVITAGIFFTKAERLKPADFKTRFSVWKYAVSAVREGKIRIIKNDRKFEISTNPLFGFGFGNWLRIFPYIPEKDTGHNFNFATEKFTHAHNDYVEVYFELGKIGIISLILLIGNIFCRFFKTWFIDKKTSKEFALIFSCLMAYLLNSTGNFISQIAISGMLLIIFYGMFEGIMREKNGQLPVVVAA